MEERLGCLHDAFKTPIAASKQLRICDDSPGGSRAQLLTTLEECLVQEVDDFLSLPSVAGRQRGRIRSFDPLNPPNLGLGLQTSQCGKDSQISLRHRAAAAAAAAASAATPIDMDGLAGTKSGRDAGGGVWRRGTRDGRDGAGSPARGPAPGGGNRCASPHGQVRRFVTDMAVRIACK